MESNYLVVLFKNKVKKKIINKFQTLNKAQEYFDKMVNQSNKTKFWVEFENGSQSSYEIGLLSKNNKDKVQKFLKDDFGRQIRVNLEDENYNIIGISKYNKPEYILNYKTKIKLSFEEFLTYCQKKTGLKLLSKLNNKIVLQVDDSFELFTLKTSEDSSRLLDSMEIYLVESKIKDFLLVKDSSTIQRKYLYKMLVECGFDIVYLRRRTTTHLK